MMRLSILFLSILPCALLAADPFAGRWTLLSRQRMLRIQAGLEVVDNAGGLQVRYQPRGGSVHPLKDSRIEGDHLILPVAAGGKQGPSIWDLTVSGDRMSGCKRMGLARLRN